MPADFNHLRYYWPKFPGNSYNVWMKTIHNTLKFDLSDVAKYRFHVLSFFYTHGLKATIDAFGVKKSTFYDWKKSYEDSGKKLSSLIPLSTRPKRLREMTTNWRLEVFIKSFRETYGNIGKEKIKPFLDEYAKSLNLSSYGATKIGKIIKRRGYFFEPKRSFKAKKKPLYPRIKRSPKETNPGYLEMDSVTIYITSKKYFFITAIDVATKFAWCKLTSSLSASQTVLALKDFLGKYPYKIHTIQTDNGAEFLGTFQSFLETSGIKHEFIYPHSPKVNGVVERFNRTIQSEFINKHEEFVLDLTDFNERMVKYLTWYNYQRPHYALKLMSPISYINNLQKEP